jgi:hypothetical protein
MADGALNAVQAATVSGRASTEIEWYDTGDGETAVPLYQYLQFNVHEIANGINFRGYGRLADDLADEDDVDSRLYYGYLEMNSNITLPLKNDPERNQTCCV